MPIIKTGANMSTNLLELQNGTDIRGVAFENEKNSINLGDEEVVKIAGGILCWLEEQKKGKLKIAIGMDSRITGEKIKKLAADEFLKTGVSVIDCGIATTPSMFMTTVWEKYSCDCGIMITASHLPYYYNGIKIFTSKGATEKSDIAKILEYAEKNSLNENLCETVGEYEKRDLLDDYSNFLVDIITSRTNMEKPFENMKIIVDAGNGAGGFFADKVLKRLGADTKGSRFLEPDGMFPNHEPNPENKNAMESISKAVLNVKADIGIIFDTDVDRAAIVTDDGRGVNRNNLIAMVSDIVLRKNPNSVIVTDSVTSDGLTEFIKKRGGVHHRFKRGYKNVINEAKRVNVEEKNKSYLAIETSGHTALEENHFLDDGTYLVAKILIESARLNREGKKLQTLIQDLRQPYESLEYRIKINDKYFKSYAEKVLDELKLYAKSQNGWEIVCPNYEGIKIKFENGWFLMRASLHEPSIVINIETDIPDVMGEILGNIQFFLKKFEKLGLMEKK